MYVRPSPRVTSPFISTVWCSRPCKPYIFWKPDDIDWDEDLQKDKYKDKDTQTQTNTKCFQDPMFAIFIKSRGFKDLKHYIGCLLVMAKTPFYALLWLNIFQEGIFFRSKYFSGVTFFQEWLFFLGEYFQEWIFFRVEYFSVVNIFQWWIFFRGEYFSVVNFC